MIMLSKRLSHSENSTYTQGVKLGSGIVYSTT